MGNHGTVAGGKVHAADSSNPAKNSTVRQYLSSQALTLGNWPVSWRLIAVIVLALVMGLIFGGLRVSAAVNSAAGFGRVTQLANLGQQVTGLVQALEDERDETTGVININGGSSSALQRSYNATNAAAARVQVLAAGVGGSFPANIGRPAWLPYAPGSHPLGLARCATRPARTRWP